MIESSGEGTQGHRKVKVHLVTLLAGDKLYFCFHLAVYAVFFHQPATKDTVEERALGVGGVVQGWADPSCSPGLRGSGGAA